MSTVEEITDNSAAIACPQPRLSGLGPRSAIQYVRWTRPGPGALSACICATGYFPSASRNQPQQETYDTVSLRTRPEGFKENRLEMLLTFRSRTFLYQPVNNAHRLHRHARDLAN